MQRPVTFDVTHLTSRLGIKTPSGIDLVDLAYGRHFIERGLGPFAHYGQPRPRLLTQEQARDVIAISSHAKWQQTSLAADVPFARVRAALTGVGGVLPDASSPTTERSPGSRAMRALLEGVLGAMKGRRLRRAGEAGEVPARAIYLNVAQHAFEISAHFAWLHQRPDVVPVFLIHDLLPLDYPEFFAAGEAAIFDRRIDMAMTHGKAFIVTTEAVRERLSAEIEARGVSAKPIVVAPLPSSLVDAEATLFADPALASTGYFVTVGTIEPRKNHLLLLSIWRAMANEAQRTGSDIPKLVIIGGRGWDNEQVLDVLERGRATRPHVIEVSGLSSAGLARLVANARALLMPSFDEGYGLPLVEALSLGTPVVVTDAPVFRQVTQGRAIYRSALDGLGWQAIIQKLSDPLSAESREARVAAQGFEAPHWPAYFERIEDFLRSL